MNITEKQKLIIDIGDYKYKLKKEDSNSPYAVVLMERIQELETKLARLKDIELKLENKALETKRTELFNARCAELQAKRNKPKTKSNTFPGVYYEVWISGNLYLECTECSADAGNCSCWSC
jgi:ABC-type dipeptide/oligopeptide/nickel transport system ATPase component